MASTLRYSFPEGDAPGIMLHSRPDSTKRERGTICTSLDNGKSWPTRRVLYPGPFAYSVLSRLPDSSAGCLFEADNYGRIVFARLSVNWFHLAKP